jgi:hypothetical protein
MKMNNRWNQFIYRLWAPIYDSILLQTGKRVLIAGIGTGADLPLLPTDVVNKPSDGTLLIAGAMVLRM